MVAWGGACRDSHTPHTPQHTHPGSSEEGHSPAPRVTGVVPSFPVGVRGAWNARSRLPPRDGSPGGQSCGSEAFANTRNVCVSPAACAAVRTWLGERESIAFKTSRPSFSSLENTLCICPSVGFSHISYSKPA